MAFPWWCKRNRVLLRANKARAFFGGSYFPNFVLFVSLTLTKIPCRPPHPPHTQQGGGKAGAADRKGGAAGHAKFKCPTCGQQAPSIKSAEMHWDSKHSKLPFVPDDWTDTHEENGGVTTSGVAIKGRAKEKTVHQLAKTEVGQKKLKEIEDAKKAAKF